MYDNRQMISYVLEAMDWDVPSAEVIAVPRINIDVDGTAVYARGLVVGVTIIDVTETFDDTTTDSGVIVGDGSDTNRYFASPTAAGEGTNSTASSASVWLPHDDAVARDEINGINNTAATDVTGQTAITVTSVESTGGTPAGKGRAIVHVAWELQVAL